MDVKKANGHSIDTLIAGFGAVVALSSAVALAQLHFPLRVAAVFPFSETYYDRSRSSPTAEESVFWALRAVTVSPGRAENWVLLASSYQREDRALSPRVVGALRSSYQVAPLSADVHDWRLTYVLSNWAFMPQDLRSAATEEARQYVRRQAGFDFLTKLQASISDQSVTDLIGVLLLEAKVDRAGLTATAMPAGD